MLGTEYRVYPDSIKQGYTYGCGGCGRVQHDIAVILADNRDGKSKGFLPLALFDLVQVAA